ncbi:hypothetical protein [Actinosynnema mirum]|uniref:Uncharacterized protein n=1 Tax=Actinosynnema mirum (strain ATCC 29888 / DSM 43827 / JCM 3225 / NBRC 14064 / NCIMB 13271 / NRRL B-12336 / IMRU 3971 / 101) TaxID=446462 RepID=C6WNK3_ACTMD|nr:hypothetical protein [Actinosynnema mirum]ACU34922.1 hypothetical protein Amir_0964 [Actinosynnema mirum DSM 43827]
MGGGQLSGDSPEDVVAFFVRGFGGDVRFGWRTGRCCGTWLWAGPPL